jgi:hypothetical protein
MVEDVTLAHQQILDPIYAGFPAAPPKLQRSILGDLPMSGWPSCGAAPDWPRKSSFSYLLRFSYLFSDIQLLSMIHARIRIQEVCHIL